MDCFGTYLTHAQRCDNNVRVHSATQWTASVHTLRMPKAVITFMFKVLQEGLLRYIHMPNAVITFMFKVLRTGLLRCILYTCPKPQSCDNVRVHSATEWTASVHTLHMPKAVITFVFIVLRNGWLRYIPYACPKLWFVRVHSATDWAASVHTLHMPKAVIKFVFELCGMDCWRTCLHMPKSVITFVFKVLRNGLCFRRFRVFAVFVFSRFRAWRFRVFVFRRRHPRGRDTDFVCTVFLVFNFEIITSF